MKNAMTVTSLWLTCNIKARQWCGVKLRGLHLLRTETHSVSWSDTQTHSEQIVESGQSFQEDVRSFVRELVPSGNEEEQTLVQIEVQVPGGPFKHKEKCVTRTSGTRGFYFSFLSIACSESAVLYYRGEFLWPVEVAPDELLDPIFALGVKILELVHRREFLDIQPVGSDNVCVGLQRLNEALVLIFLLMLFFRCICYFLF